MDKYAVYHNIKQVNTIVSQYPAAAEVSRELAGLADQLTSRVYRVAVIGEFNRGKSSLVNCILGTEILPTDILPTTAVVNRIVYGTEQKIEICYKDGTVKNVSVEELAEYATKKNETNTSLVREIVVHYPAVFCQNSIELLDTPGLNDDEFMDKTTLDVLDHIDTAIVTTHASYPVSETEKKLICKLIEQDDIHHLTFVATFIDQVSDKPEEQDQVVKLIQSRLAKDTYQMFRQKHPNEPQLLEKAQRILCNPVVFAVSSRLAMRGFVNGSKKMLDESRFPYFKYQLAALMTANQELDFQLKAARVIRIAKENFVSWHEQLMSDLKTEQKLAQNTLRTAQVYQKSGCQGLVEQLMQFDRELENSLFPRNEAAFGKSELVRRMTWIIIRNLLQIDPQTVDEAQIRKALQDASEEMESNPNKLLEEQVCKCMQKINAHLIASEKQGGLSEDALVQRLEVWKNSKPFPQLDKRVYDLQGMINADALVGRIRTSNVVELAKLIRGLLCNKLYPYQTALQDQIQSYIASWRSQILKQNIEDKNEMGRIAEDAAQQIRNILQRENSATVNYESNLSVLAQAEKEINSEQI